MALKLLAFSEGSLPIIKGLRGVAEVITAWPAGEGSADLLYDPNQAELKDIIRRLPRGFNPEAILITNLNYATFIWGLHECGIPVVAPVTNSILCSEVLRNASPFVDLFVCNEERHVDQMKALGTEATYLPWYGLDPAVCYPEIDDPRWDVVFAGNLNPSIHKKRGKLLELLLSVPQRFNTRVLTGLSTQEYARALARARIVFNYSIRGEVNRRVYEALGVSRLLLVEESNAEVLRYFESGRHVVSYSESNLIERIEYYLSHESEREAIARAGHEEALSKHTGSHKARRLLEALENHIKSAKPKIRSATVSELHRSAARIFLHHGRTRQALLHSDEAIASEDAPANRIVRARILGSMTHFHKDSEGGSIDEFQRATERAIEVVPEGSWTRFNHLEFGCRLGRPCAGLTRDFIDEILSGQLQIEAEGGPLPIAFDRFRMAWEEVASRRIESPELHQDVERGVILARAYELLAEEERRAGRLPAALEAYRESLKLRNDGHIEHRLASLAAELGHSDVAREAIKNAIMAEPFFHGARADLAALELNRGAHREARAAASEALLTLTTAFQPFQSLFVEILDRTSSPGELEPYTLAKPILWEGLSFGMTGHSRGALLLVDELLGRGLPITVGSYDSNGLEAPMSDRMKARFRSASQRPLEWDFVQITHKSPDAFERRVDAKAAICRTSYGLDPLPRSWGAGLGALDHVWVTSEFTQRRFLEAGMPPDRVVVIPHPIGKFPLPPLEVLSLEEDGRFHFLSILEWDLRSGWDILLRAFLSEFRRADDVSLLLRVSSIDGKSQVEIRDEMRGFIRSELGRDPDQSPDILFIDETLSDGEMRALYQQANAFVLPSRAEGFGRVYLEALIAGLPTIGTAWGGQLDFLSKENGYLIDVEDFESIPEEVGQCRGARWAQPSIDHLRVILRQVYEDPEEGRGKARRSAGELLSRYNVQRVANLVVRELNRIEEEYAHGA